MNESTIKKRKVRNRKCVFEQTAYTQHYYRNNQIKWTKNENNRLHCRTQTTTPKCLQKQHSNGKSNCMYIWSNRFWYSFFEVMKKKGSWTWQQKINCKYKTLCTTLYNTLSEHRHSTYSHSTCMNGFGYMMLRRKRSWGHFIIEIYLISLLQCVYISLSLSLSLYLIWVVCVCVLCMVPLGFKAFHVIVYVISLQVYIYVSHLTYIYALCVRAQHLAVNGSPKTQHWKMAAAISTGSFPINANRAQHWTDALNLKKIIHTV